MDYHPSQHRKGVHYGAVCGVEIVIAPGRCQKCTTLVLERFPIIVAGEDCRPRYCRDCATPVNVQTASVPVVEKYYSGQFLSNGGM